MNVLKEICISLSTHNIVISRNVPGQNLEPVLARDNSPNRKYPEYIFSGMLVTQIYQPQMKKLINFNPSFSKIEIHRVNF